MMIYTLESFKFTLCNGKSVCIQTKHQEPSQIVPSIFQLTYICTKYQTTMMIYTLESFKLTFAQVNRCAFRGHIWTRARLFHYNFS